MEIHQIFGRDESKTRSLAENLSATPVFDISAIDENTDLLLLAVKDDVISKVTAALGKRNEIVAHTSGTASSGLLADCSPNYGVFYPLQTFSKEKEVNFHDVPILVSANNSTAQNALLYLGQKLSETVQQISDRQRELLHLAAVMVNNFTNHLFALSNEILEENELQPDLLHPLIKETFAKTQLNDPATIQTGPAVRGDMATINRHMELLKKHPQILQVYQSLTSSIISKHGKNEV